MARNDAMSRIADSKLETLSCAFLKLNLAPVPMTRRWSNHQLQFRYTQWHKSNLIGACFRFPTNSMKLLVQLLSCWLRMDCSNKAPLPCKGPANGRKKFQEFVFRYVSGFSYPFVAVVQEQSHGLPLKCDLLQHILLSYQEHLSTALYLVVDNKTLQFN